MTVSELIDLLSTVPGDTQIVLAASPLALYDTVSIDLTNSDNALTFLSLDRH